MRIGETSSKVCVLIPIAHLKGALSIFVHQFELFLSDFAVYIYIFGYSVGATRQMLLNGILKHTDKKLDTNSFKIMNLDFQ